MLTPNGQCTCQKSELTNASADTRHVSKNCRTLLPIQAEFISHLEFHGIDDLIRSLKMIHDFALYHTDLCFDKEEKSALYDLKILWESLERLGRC